MPAVAADFSGYAGKFPLPFSEESFKQFVRFIYSQSLLFNLIPNLKPQIPQISQISGERKTVSANYIFVPDESLRQITLNSLVSVICGICEICGYLLSSVFGFNEPSNPQ